jgi:beta-N-acetylhexosaminidase
MMRKLSLGVVLVLSLCIILTVSACAGQVSKTSNTVTSTTSGSQTSSTPASGSASTSTTDSGTQAGQTAGSTDSVRAQAQALLKKMTLRQKAAQVLLLDFTGVETGTAQLRQLLDESPPGGLMIMGRNVKSPAQVKTMVDFFQKRAADGGSPVQLLIAVDQEGGTVQRIRAGVPAIPAARTLGSTSTPAHASEIATQTATELLAMGVNMNLAPVADVVKNKGEFLYSRTYGGDPGEVADFVTAVTKAFNHEGLITTLKHFPGHGSASGNTHTAAVVSNATKQDFEKVHLVPFEAGIEAGAEAVLVAHVVAKAYDPKYPATSSRKVVQGLLREQLGFNGVVVTDALEMAAARTVGTTVGPSGAKDVAQTAVSALNAGCDLLISTGTITGQSAILDAIVKAVKNGDLPLTRLNEAVTRILELKVRHGLDNE